MDQAGIHFAQPGFFTLGQPDGVAVKPALAQKPMAFVSIEIVAGRGEQGFDPCNLIRLFREVGLHQAVRVFGPKSAHGRQLFWCRCGREPGRDDIGQPVHVVPFCQKRLAVVIGRLGRIAQPVGGVAVHAGFASPDPLPARLCGSKDGVNAGRVDGGIAAKRGRAVGQRQIAIAVGNGCRVIGVGKASFFGEGVAVQPINQTFAPRGDDGGLGVMHMGIDKACRNQMLAVIGDARSGMGGF